MPVAALAAVILTATLWMPLFGYFLIRADPPVKADMVVVLAGDETGQRIIKASELVRQGYAPRILVSGPGPEYGLYESELAINYAVSRGYPRSWFIPFPHRAPSTVLEALTILPAVRRMHVHTLDIVTSDYHTRRAGNIYHRYAPDLDIHMVAAPSLPFRPYDWWKGREASKRFATEWAKTVAYWIGL